MESTVLQWHPGFQAVLQIELSEEKERLQFNKEYNLTDKPLQIDTLIIKLAPGRKIRKSIGHLFRQYNIVEYKSPDDYVSVNDFYKVTGYASVFQSNTEKEQEIPPQEITMTFAVSHYPMKLICFLKDTYGAVINTMAPGITYISGLLFPIQILQLPKLDPDEYLWLSRLRRNLAKDDLDCLSRAYLPKQRNPLYHAAMNLVLRANPEESREGKEMLEALQELFPEEFREKNMLLEEQQKKLDLQQKELDEQQIKLETQQAKLNTQQIELETQQAMLNTQQIELETQQVKLNSQQIELEAQQTMLSMQAEKIEQSDQEIRMLRKQLEKLKKPTKQNRKLEKLKKQNRKLKKKLNLRKVKHDMKCESIA